MYINLYKTNENRTKIKSIVFAAAAVDVAVLVAVAESQVVASVAEVAGVAFYLKLSLLNI